MAAPGRLDLLKDGYKEVLDATKHQDDKMGRLLTAVAFLIGGSLALGALASAVPLGRHFVVGADRLPPLTLIAIVGFETCASVAALLLLYGLTTPLRLPGVLDRRSSAATSQIYFLSIARQTSDAWKATWSPDREATLVAEQAEMYVDEVYNLAVRTQFKYDRANEAVAVLSLGLLGFACAVPLAFSSASGTSDPASFGLGISLLVACLLGLYCFVTQLTRVRISQVNTEDLRAVFDIGTRPGLRIFSGRLNALALAVASAGSVYVDSGTTPVDIVVWVGLVTAIGSSVPTVLHSRTLRVAELSSFASNLVSCLICATFVVVAIVTGERSWGLLSAIVLPAGVAISALIAPSAATADRRRASTA